MKVKFVIFIVLVFSFFQLYAHSGKPKYHIIVDTDGAIDDLRALSVLLAAKDVRILGITASQGVLMPDEVTAKLQNLLTHYRHEGIPIGTGKSTDFPAPPWAEFARSVAWGNHKSDCLLPPQTAQELLSDRIFSSHEKVILIALGSLKTYADLIKLNPEAAAKIERIIWYSGSDTKSSFNYKASPESFEFFQKSEIALHIVSNNRQDLLIDEKYLKVLKNTSSVYANHLHNVHQQKSVQHKIAERHLHLWDDLIPLYLATPLFFNSEKKENISYITPDKSVPATFFYEITGDILMSGSKTEDLTFKTFPLDTALYTNAYAQNMRQVIDAYGMREWKVVTLTNEIHGHIGIYSIVGAKMGIRAIEYFRVGVNNVFATSYAGYRPPLSCLNDGIQIGSGATIGQGLIHVPDTVLQTPTAIFEHNGVKIKISLKSLHTKQIQEDIKKGVEQYNFSERYWRYIEELAANYWTEFSRHEIFDIEVL